jgi:phage terminase large subunit-like protein
VPDWLANLAPAVKDRATREGWLSRIVTASDVAAANAGCYFDAAAGERVVMFFERFLRHSKAPWAGKPFTLMDWQKDDVLRPLFGWKRADGTRRFRVGYIEIPKKNGKSTLCAGLSLFLLMADGETGAEVYSAAADRDQASIVFNEAAKMAQAAPALAPRLEIIHSRKTIHHAASGSVYRALSAEVNTKEGLNISGLIFDELHAQKSPELWDALRYGGASRRQPLLVAITTAGCDRQSIGWEQHEYAAKVLEGAITDEAFFAFIRAATPEDDWTSPATWRKANPSLGITISEEDFAKDCAEARELARKENPFKRYRLNIWTEQADRWLQMDKWDACAGEVDEAQLIGRPCYAGLDLASTTDVAALVLVFPDEGGALVMSRFWIPSERSIERQRRDGVPYETWVKQGLIERTQGNVIDYDLIRKRINELGQRYEIRQIAIDRWNATQLATQLSGDGLEVVMFGQGFASMSAPTKELEKLVLAGRLAHGGNEVLRWMAGNVATETDAAGNVKPSKKKSTQRIDGIVALIMALGVMGASGGPQEIEPQVFSL